MADPSSSRVRLRSAVSRETLIGTDREVALSLLVSGATIPVIWLVLGLGGRMGIGIDPETGVGPLLYLAVGVGAVIVAERDERHYASRGLCRGIALFCLLVAVFHFPLWRTSSTQTHAVVGVALVIVSVTGIHSYINRGVLTCCLSVAVSLSGFFIDIYYSFDGFGMANSLLESVISGILLATILGTVLGLVGFVIGRLSYRHDQRVRADDADGERT